MMTSDDKAKASDSKSNAEDKTKAPAKITVIKPAEDDAEETCRTFVIYKEDHTLGNSLRYMMMKDPMVEFCGYTVPHPSEDKINFRVQTMPGCSAEDALRTGLSNLKGACQVIDDKFDTAMQRFQSKQETEDQ